MRAYTCDILGNYGWKLCEKKEEVMLDEKIGKVARSEKQEKKTNKKEKKKRIEKSLKSKEAKHWCLKIEN